MAQLLLETFTVPEPNKQYVIYKDADTGVIRMAQPYSYSLETIDVTAITPFEDDSTKGSLTLTNDLSIYQWDGTVFTIVGREQYTNKVPALLTAGYQTVFGYYVDGVRQYHEGDNEYPTVPTPEAGQYYILGKFKGLWTVVSSETEFNFASVSLNGDTQYNSYRFNNGQIVVIDPSVYYGSRNLGIDGKWYNVPVRSGKHREFEFDNETTFKYKGVSGVETEVIGTKGFGVTVPDTGGDTGGDNSGGGETTPDDDDVPAPSYPNGGVDTSFKVGSPVFPSDKVAPEGYIDARVIKNTQLQPLEPKKLYFGSRGKGEVTILITSNATVYIKVNGKTIEAGASDTNVLNDYVRSLTFNARIYSMVLLSDQQVTVQWM